jgi:hypothetical protein
LVDLFELLESMTTFVFFVNWLEHQSWKSGALGTRHFCNWPTAWIMLLAMFLSLQQHYKHSDSNTQCQNIENMTT